MDYERGIFPRLPRELHANLRAIEWFTVGLSIIGIWIAILCLLIRKKRNT